MKKLKVAITCSGCGDGITTAHGRRFREGRVVCLRCVQLARFAEEYSPSLALFRKSSVAHVARAMEKLRQFRAA